MWGFAWCCRARCYFCDQKTSTCVNQGGACVSVAHPQSVPMPRPGVQRQNTACIMTQKVSLLRLPAERGPTGEPPSVLGAPASKQSALPPTRSRSASGSTRITCRHTHTHTQPAKTLAATPHLPAHLASVDVRRELQAAQARLGRADRSCRHPAAACGRL